MIKKSTLILALSLGCVMYGQGQAVAHKPTEIAKIMKDSKLNYSIDTLYVDIQDKDYSNLVNEPNTYREDSGEQMLVKKMNLSKDAQTEWDAAERAFMQDNNYKEARKHYKNVLDIQQDYYPAKIEMAKTFEKEGDLEKAEASYKQAISKNYVDYMPHWLMAKDYFAEKKYDEAVSEITLASVLNRNDTAILLDLGEIYAAAHLKYEDWEFTPQYKVFKGMKENEIKVLSQKGWRGYAVGKAIWDFEPGYPESQGEHPGKPSLIQEKECLLSLLAGQDTMKDASDDITILAVQDAKEYKLLDGFIYYEELLPQNPSLVYQLPNNVIKGVKNYVILAHGGEAPKK